MKSSKRGLVGRLVMVALSALREDGSGSSGWKAGVHGMIVQTTAAPAQGGNGIMMVCSAVNNK